MKEEKISINKNSEVTEILLQDKKAIGIKVNKKKIYADKIVLNTDPAFTYKNLINSENNVKWNKKKVEKMDYSMGLFVIYFGTSILYCTSYNMDGKEISRLIKGYI